MTGKGMQGLWVLYDVDGLRPVASGNAMFIGWCGRWLVERAGGFIVRDPLIGDVVTRIQRPPGLTFDSPIADPSGDRLLLPVRPATALTPGDRFTPLQRGPAGPVGLWLYEAATGREVWGNPEIVRDGSFGPLGAIRTIFSPDGKRVAVSYPSARDERLVWIGRADNGAAERTITIPGDAGRPADPGPIPVWFSPDARRLAAGRGPALFVWDADTGELLWRLQGHDTSVSWAAFSPDGSRLFSAERSISGHIRLIVWDLATGRELISLPLPDSGGAFPRQLSALEGDKFYLTTEDGVRVFDGTPRKE